jgi:hypothetical protein
MKSYSPKRLLLLACCLCLWGSAAADETKSDPAAEAVPPTPFATVLRARGQITLGEGVSSKSLAVGDTVWAGQRLRADKNGEALLKTADAGFVALRPGAELIIERYAARGLEDDTLTLRLVRGGLRMVTGWIGKFKKKNYQISTTWGTVGIRGTDHEPYVLTADLAGEMSQAEGTYDKVNAGGTTLESNGGSVDVEPGKVGFAKAVRRRALITLVLPTLLERIPDFFVPGAFDEELVRLSAATDTGTQQQLAALKSGQGTVAGAATVPEPAPVQAAAVAVASSVASGAPAKPPASDSCGSLAIGTRWLAGLDAAIQRRDTPAILAMFAPDIQITATVNNSNGTQSQMVLDAGEFAGSATAAMLGLSEYSQRRPKIEARPQASISCSRIVLSSVVIEQGRQGARSYRFESAEDYVLEQRGGVWIAIEASTRQR